MSLFLISFLSLYGGMHVYAFVRLRGAFSPGQPATAALAGWMMMMTVAPLLVRMAEGAGLERAALLMAWPGYIWMGSIFIFCAALAAVDTLRIAAWLAHRIFRTTHPGYLTATITCEIALFLALLASGYALYEAHTNKDRTGYDHHGQTTTCGSQHQGCADIRCPCGAVIP